MPRLQAARLFAHGNSEHFSPFDEASARALAACGSKQPDPSEVCSEEDLWISFQLTKGTLITSRLRLAGRSPEEVFLENNSESASYRWSRISTQLDVRTADKRESYSDTYKS